VFDFLAGSLYLTDMDKGDTMNDLFTEMGFDQPFDRWDAEREDDLFDVEEEDHPDEWEEFANLLDDDVDEDIFV
jgi:hypothetical protein